VTDELVEDCLLLLTDYEKVCRASVNRIPTTQYYRANNTLVPDDARRILSDLDTEPLVMGSGMVEAQPPCINSSESIMTQINIPGIDHKRKSIETLSSSEDQRYSDTT